MQILTAAHSSGAAKRNKVMQQPKIVGIVNITADSFSDGGKFLDPGDAIAHMRQLVADGADLIELGPASSHPDAADVPADEQIARLEPVLAAATKMDVPVSVDATKPAVQAYAAQNGASFLNDIAGFPDAKAYPMLADSDCGLVLMHSVVTGEKARRVDTAPDTIMDRLLGFFDARLDALEKAGIGRSRVIIDPGMGFFLGTNPDTSVTVLRQIFALKNAFGLPVMISVSRKSFLQRIAGRPVDDVGAATLAAELYATRQGADYIRTHAPGPLKDALAVTQALYG